MLRCFFRALEFTQSNNQYHRIHLYFHIISLEPPSRALCFSFGSTHKCSKDLSRKQTFINLSFSLSRLHEKTECCNFINNQLTPDSPINTDCLQLEKTQCNKLMEDNETVDLQIKFQRSGLFSWVTLKVQICRLSFSKQNIKLKTKKYVHITLIL